MSEKARGPLSRSRRPSFRRAPRPHPDHRYLGTPHRHRSRPGLHYHDTPTLSQDHPWTEQRTGKEVQSKDWKKTRTLLGLEEDYLVLNRFKKTFLTKESPVRDSVDNLIISCFHRYPLDIRSPAPTQRYFEIIMSLYTVTVWYQTDGVSFGQEEHELRRL